MLNAQEAIEKFLDFEKRATAARSTQITRIKEDREFLSGKQWDKDDGKLISAKRNRRVVNILSNATNSVVNQFANYPYKWYAANEEIDTVCEAFLKTGSNLRSAFDVLRSTVSFGLGYFAIGSERITDAGGNSAEIPSLYSIDRVENVYFDPDSVSITGADAIEAAVVEMRSKNYIRAMYGEEWATAKGYRSLVNVSDNVDSEQQPIVTYFRVEDGRCTVYTLLNNDFLQDPQQLDINRVPVFPCYGEACWDGDRIIYQGLVRKGAPVQKLVNYAFTQLAERMAVAPKPVFLTTPEAVENYDDGYKNFANNLNPLLLYNRTSPDKKTEYEPPTRLDNRVQFDDITGIIGSQLDLMSTITGVDSRGLLNDAPQRTATEVIYSDKNVQLSTSHYFANLRDTFKAVGETVIKLLGGQDVTLDVIQGPGEYMEKQVARQELVQLAGIVSDQDKMKLVDGILLSHNDNAILRNVLGALHAQPAPTAMEQQAFDTIEQMKQAIGDKDSEIARLQEQIKNYEQAMDNEDKSIQAKFAEMQMKHHQDLERIAFEKRLDQGADAAKAAVDAEKAQMDLEQKAIQLDATKVKAASEMFKAITAPQGGMKNED